MTKGFTFVTTNLPDHMAAKNFFTFFTKLLRNCFIRVANLRYFAKLKIKIWGKFRIFSKLSLLKDNHKKWQDKRINVLACGTCVQYVFSFSSGQHIYTSIYHYLNFKHIYTVMYS